MLAQGEAKNRLMNIFDMEEPPTGTVGSRFEITPQGPGKSLNPISVDGKARFTGGAQTQT